MENFCHEKMTGGKNDSVEARVQARVRGLETELGCWGYGAGDMGLGAIDSVLSVPGVIIMEGYLP